MVLLRASVVVVVGPLADVTVAALFCSKVLFSPDVAVAPLLVFVLAELGGVELAEPLVAAPVVTLPALFCSSVVPVPAFVEVPDDWVAVELVRCWARAAPVINQAQAKVASICFIR